MASQQAQSVLQQRAAQMRAWMTPSEARLWSRLNAKQLGVQFRRQVVVAEKPQVLVGGQHQHRPTLALHPNAVMRADFGFERVGTLFFQRVDFSVQPRVVTEWIASGRVNLLSPINR